jgi:hypothetical protein
VPWCLEGDVNIRRREKELVKECDVYLSGHYADYLETRNRPVPGWAWLSVLAHARPEQLRELVAEDAGWDRGRTRTTVWWQAVGFLAGEILAQQEAEGSLDELRRSVLVPLELKWLTEDRTLQRPRELVRTVLDALDQFPSSRPR